MSENGWTDDLLCEQWFKKSFIPQATARNKSENPILLIMDNHGSHVKPRIIRAAVENNIHIYTFPPHTTHKLQPLDVGVFSSLQRKWQQRCDARLEEDGEEMPREDFVKEYMLARSESFVRSTILKAWEKSGINPFNPDIFTERDYAPSHISSSKSHFPLGYPTLLHYEESSSEGEDDIPDVSDSDGERHTSAVTVPQTSHPIPSSGSPSSAATPGPISSSVARPSKQSIGAESPETDAYQRLLAENKALLIRARAAETHCKIAQIQNDNLQKRLNSKTSRKQKRGTIAMEPGFVTSQAALEASNKQEAEREAERLEKERKQAEAAEKERRRQEWREANAPTMSFSGAWSSKKKSDVQDIAFALSIPTAGTVNQLVDSIKAHLEVHPELKTDPRFVALYSNPRGRKRAIPDDFNNENVPPATRSRSTRSPSPTYIIQRL